MRLLPALLLLTSCVEPVKVHASEEALEVIAELAPVEYAYPEEASIIVTRVARRDDAVGKASTEGCVRVVTAPEGCACPNLEAHEVGHALGLSHSKIRGNPMHPTFLGDTWTDKQRRIAERNHRFLTEICH